MRGSRGEFLAEQYLVEAGLAFVERNWSCAIGEIDLIFIDGNEVVFVEVKTRRWREASGYGVFANITHEKSRRLFRLARYYLQRKFWRGAIPSFRVDHVGVVLYDDPSLPAEIEHRRGSRTNYSR